MYVESEGRLYTQYRPELYIIKNRQFIIFLLLTCSTLDTPLIILSILD